MVGGTMAAGAPHERALEAVLRRVLTKELEAQAPEAAVTSSCFTEREAAGVPPAKRVLSHSVRIAAWNQFPVSWWPGSWRSVWSIPASRQRGLSVSSPTYWPAAQGMVRRETL